MNMKLIIFILACFKAANLQRSHLRNILESKTNFFQKINSKIHTIANKLLISLKLDKEFKKSDNSQMLLTMHFYLNNIAERNCRVYKELRNISDAKVNRSNKNNLKKILLDIVTEEIDRFNNITHVTNNTFETKAMYNKTEDTEDILYDLSMLWSKISKLTIENITGPVLHKTKVPSSAAEYSFKTGSESMESEEISGLAISGEETEIADTRRIYKGKKTKVKNYPFLASIHMMSKFLCAGSIISEDIIITAASCLQIAYKNKLYRENPRTIFVRVGSDYTKRSGELIPIVKIIFHPKYDSVTLRHNLAIVKMLDKVKHSTKSKIRLIKYDRNADALSNDVEDITILGWGDKSVKQKYSNMQKLTFAHLDVYNFKDCQEVYSKYYVYDTNFCAGFTHRGGGACTGDIGGPAVVAEELVGLISFGPTVCGMPDAPTVFIKIGYYAQWIDNVIHQKPVTRFKKITRPTLNSSNSLTSPRPTTTTTLSRVKAISKHKVRSEVRSDSKDYPDEIKILKRLIQKLIIANSSVIKYIMNGETLANIYETTTTKNKRLFLDPENYKPGDSDINKNLDSRNNATKSVSSIHLYEAKNNSFSNNAVTQLYKEYLESTSVKLDYGTETFKKKTTRKTVIEYSEFQKEDDSNNNIDDDVSSNPDETSSYYEREIPIEVPLFKETFFDRNTTTVSERSTSIELVEIKHLRTSAISANFQTARAKFIDVNPSDNENNEQRNTRNYREEIKTVNKKFPSEIRSKEEHRDPDKVVELDPFPLGIAMAISNEDFNYADDDNDTLEIVMRNDE